MGYAARPPLGARLWGVRPPVATPPPRLRGLWVRRGLRSTHSQGAGATTARLHQLQEVSVPELGAWRRDRRSLLGSGQPFRLRSTQHMQRQTTQRLRKALLHGCAQVRARVPASQAAQQQPPRSALRALLRRHLRAGRA